MSRFGRCAAVTLLLASVATAQTPGFLQSDLGKARSEAAVTGKLVFIYFNLPG